MVANDGVSSEGEDEIFDRGEDLRNVKKYLSRGKCGKRWKKVDLQVQSSRLSCDPEAPGGGPADSTSRMALTSWPSNIRTLNSLVSVVLSWDT